MRKYVNESNFDWDKKFNEILINFSSVMKKFELLFNSTFVGGGGCL